MEDTRVDLQDIFAHHAQEEEDDAGEDGRGSNNRINNARMGGAIGDRDKKEHQIHHKAGKAKESEERADKRGDADEELGIRSDAIHGHVVKGTEIVVALAGTTFGLDIFNAGHLVAEFGNDATHIGVRIVEAGQHLNKTLVIQPKTREILDLFNIGDPVDNVVLKLPDGVHDGVGFALFLRADDDTIAFFPFMDELGN